MSTADMETIQNPESKNGSSSDNHDEQPPNCLAQADVRTPWLDINARFQLRGRARADKPEKEKSERSTNLPFFGLPKFRKKGKPNSTASTGTSSNFASRHTSNNSDRGNAVSSSHSADDLSSNSADESSQNSTDGTSGNTSEGSAQSSSDGWHDLSIPAKRRIWQGWEGLAITTFGIALPSLVLAMSAMSMPKRMTLVMLNHPLETIAELLLLISSGGR